MMMIKPLTKPCRWGETFIKFIILLRMPKIKMPKIVPMILPRPPVMRVPPMITAAMASSSYCAPELEDEIEFNRDVSMTAATPTSVPISV